jgi:glycosyltransferase involved in cell wall biosynthesis
MNPDSRPPISVTIITLNEEKNLPRAIKSVAWADEVLVVDSGSTDRTLEIAKNLGAKVVSNSWSGYGQQKNFAQERAGNDWILNIDADEEVSPELAQQIQATIARANTAGPYGFYFPRKTFYLGRWIRHGGWYPNHLVRLAHRKHASWTEPSVHEELKVSGPTQLLSEPLLHYTFSSIQEQILTNLRYARLGSERLKQKGQPPSYVKLVWKPIGKFFETYLIKCGFLDGLPGFIISVNAAHSMFLKYSYLYEARLHENPHHRQHN